MSGRICVRKRDGKWYLTRDGIFPPNGIDSHRDALIYGAIINWNHGQIRASAVQEESK